MQYSPSFRRVVSGISTLWETNILFGRRLKFFPELLDWRSAVFGKMLARNGRSERSELSHPPKKSIKSYWAVLKQIKLWDGFHVTGSWLKNYTKMQVNQVTPYTRGPPFILAGQDRIQRDTWRDAWAHNWKRMKNLSYVRLFSFNSIKINLINFITLWRPTEWSGNQNQLTVLSSMSSRSRWSTQKFWIFHLGKWRSHNQKRQSRCFSTYNWEKISALPSCSIIIITNVFFI